MSSNDRKTDHLLLRTDGVRCPQNEHQAEREIRRPQIKAATAQAVGESATRQADGLDPFISEKPASALARASTRDMRILAVLALARAGDSARAQTIADELEKQNPVNTVIVGYWLPTIRAAIEMNRDNPAKAIGLLQAATSYELGNPTPTPEWGGFLYPAYVRGQAYLRLHQAREAAAEFQKFVEHQGVVGNCALARLGVARSSALQGDTAKSRTAYNDFFTLWKDADPDIPILQQAKAEYAKLQ